MTLSELIAELSVKVAKFKAEIKYLNDQKKEVQSKLDEKIAEYQVLGDKVFEDSSELKDLEAYIKQLDLFK